MNKYNLVTIIAIIVIIIPFAYSGLNVYGAQQAKFSWDGEKNFSFYKMTNQGDLKVCNTLPVPITFQKVEFAIFFEKQHKGSVTYPTVTLQPGENSIDGNFKAEHFAGTQYLFMEFDAQFNGISTVRHDLSKLIIVRSIDVPILGLIPYTSTEQVSAIEFKESMDKENFVC